MKNENYYMLAKTMFGLEEILAKELTQLGAQNIKILNRAVSFKGDKGFMYKANLNLRTALRILKPIKHFQAYNEKDLYKNLFSINWPKILSLNNTFMTSATTKSEDFQHSKYASLVMKDAIADSFRKKYNTRPNVDTKNPDISVHLHISKNTCSVFLDSSGTSLHKRGYKLGNVLAPINEVLAAGLILKSKWNKKDNFYDPMCGSGTIIIEAALIAYNIPANIFRKKFSFENWKDFDEKLWKKIKDKSLDKEVEYNGIISGSDNCTKSLNICERNIQNSLLDDKIKIKKSNFFKKEINKNTFVIFNPPYGERIKIRDKEFYSNIGTTLKHNYLNSEIWIISSDIENMKFIGLKPTTKFKIINSNLECSFRQYLIYSGSKKQKNSE
tara:strand:+ start:614 stop:1768 length:1155 start_codon:yes stop_codon:yes gene_type:complete